jgi:hypothetical protein
MSSQNFRHSSLRFVIAHLESIKHYGNRILKSKNEAV